MRFYMQNIPTMKSKEAKQKLYDEVMERHQAFIYQVCRVYGGDVRGQRFGLEERGPAEC